MAQKNQVGWRKKGKFNYNVKTKKIIYVRPKYKVNKTVGYSIMLVYSSGRETEIGVRKTRPQAQKVVKSYMENYI